MAETKIVLDSVLRYASNRFSSGAASATWDYDPGNDGVVISCSESKTGSKLHDWKRRIAKGQSATTPFSGDISTLATLPALENVYGSTVSNPNTSSAWRKAAGKWSHGISSVPSLPSINDVQTAQNIASTKFYKKLQETMSAFQGGIFLAELRETLHMIRNPAKSLREHFSAYQNTLTTRRGKIMRLPKQNRISVLSDIWLEHAFGWAPALNDLRAATKVLEKRQNQLVNTLIRIYADGLVARTEFTAASFASGALNLSCLRRQVSRTQQIYAGAVSSTCSGSPLITASSLGFNPYEFVPTLWEAAPWSFAIDYFTNVGDVLNAWSYQHVKLAWGRQTLRRSNYLESTRCYPIPAPGLVLVFEHYVFDGKTIARKKTVDRSAIGTPPIPSLSFEMPGFGTKWLNIIALQAGQRSLRFH